MTNSMSMTDKQLDNLVKEITNAFPRAVSPIATALQSIANADLAYLIGEYKQLRAENQTLQAENAAMRPMVEVVASDRFTNFDTLRCGWGDDPCHPIWSEHFSEWRHAPDCPVTQARAYLAEHPAQEGEAHQWTR